MLAETAPAALIRAPSTRAPEVQLSHTARNVIPSDATAGRRLNVVGKLASAMGIPDGSSTTPPTVIRAP